MAMRQSATAATSILGSSPLTFIRRSLLQIGLAGPIGNPLLAPGRARGGGVRISPVAGPPVDGPARVVRDQLHRCDIGPLRMAVHIVGVDTVGMDGDREGAIPTVVGPGAAPRRAGIH